MIEQIKGKDVLKAVKKIEDRGAQEMAKRAIPLAGRVFRYAIRKDLIENDPTPHLSEALKPRLSNLSSIHWCTSQADQPIRDSLKRVMARGCMY